MKNVYQLNRSQILENIRDSVYHALKHYSAATENKSESLHHFKWIILSIHHAAEAYLKLILSEVDPNNEIFSKTKRDGNIFHPSALQTLEELKNHKNSLSIIEVKLLDVVTDTITLRDELTHSPVLKIDDISPAVWTSLVIIRSLAIREKITVKELLDQSPSIEVDVIDFLGWEHHSSYQAFVEEALKIEFPNRHFFLDCPLCGALAVVDTRCEGCFHEMNINECFSCGDEFATWIDSEHSICPCGAQHNTLS